MLIHKQCTRSNLAYLLISVMMILFSFISCSQQRKYPVVLITIDTCRQDHLACYGMSDIMTPVLDKLSRQGVLYTSARTDIPITLPAHCSIMTGLHPPTLGVRNNGDYKLTENAKTLAEILGMNGYATGGFIGAFPLDSRYGLDQGFNVYDDRLDPGKSEGLLFHFAERKAGKVTSSAVSWLSKLDLSKPFFTWIHYFDPHNDYDPPGPYKKMYPGSPYKGEISYVDHNIGKIMEFLALKNLYQDSLVIILADHGEGLGQHGERTHAMFVYDSTVLVPLIVKYPKNFKMNGLNHENTRTADILPTVLDILKIPVSDKIEGISLLGNRREPLFSYSESFHSKLAYNWSGIVALTDGRFKYIHAPKPELFNLEIDPGERVNIFSHQPNEAKKLLKQLNKMLYSFKPIDTGVNGVSIDQESIAKLAALGYVSGTTSSQNSKLVVEPALPDPKDMLEVVDLFSVGKTYMENADYEKGIKIFKQILELDPGNRKAHQTIGDAYFKLDRLDEALKEYETALKYQQDSMVYNNIGVIYQRKKEFEKAVPTFKRAIQLNPFNQEALINLGDTFTAMEEYSKAELYYIKARDIGEDYRVSKSLGILYWKTNEHDKAIKSLEKALSDNSESPDVYRLLGVIYQLRKQFPKAVTAYQKLIEYNPDSVYAHVNLAKIFMESKQYKKATEHFMEILKRRPEFFEVCNNVAWLMSTYNTGSLETARKYAEKAVKGDPGKPEYFKTLASILIQQGETKRPKNILLKLQKSYPNDPEIIDMLNKMNKK